MWCTCHGTVACCSPEPMFSCWGIQLLTLVSLGGQKRDERPKSRISDWHVAHRVFPACPFDWAWVCSWCKPRPPSQGSDPWVLSLDKVSAVRGRTCIGLTDAHLPQEVVVPFDQCHIAEPFLEAIAPFATTGCVWWCYPCMSELASWTPETTCIGSIRIREIPGMWRPWTKHGQTWWCFENCTTWVG